MNNNIKEKEIKTYWSIVWGQFKKRKIAMISLYVILIFFFIAIFAPFLANRRPIVLYTTYGEFYQYYFASWNKTHNSYKDNLLEHSSLTKMLKESQLKFDEHKEKIHDLNIKYDEVKNNEEEIKDQIEQLEKSIERLKNGSETNNKEKINSIIKDKKELETKRKKIGGEALTLKQKMFEANKAQEKINFKLTEYKYRIDYKNISQFVVENLSKLKFYVSPEVQSKIDHFTIQYDQLFTKYHQNINSLDSNSFKQDMEKLHQDILNQLKYNSIKNELEYRLTFPVIDHLGWLDILLFIVFIYLIVYLLFNKAIKSKITDQRKRKQAYLYLLLGLTVIFSLLFINLRTSQIVPTNYKKLIATNFNNSSKKDYAVYPPVKFGFNENNFEERLQKAFDTESRHLLGTDATGRDVLSRMIWGARVSLSIGFVAVSIYSLIGIIVGSLAGYFGGWVDIILSRIIEIVICFPSFFLILTIIAFLGPSIINIMIIIGLTSWTGIARLIRGEFLKLRKLDFVTSAKALGVSPLRIIFRHILPNALTPVLVSAAFGIASAMLTEAGLSFLGFGVRDPFPSWGQMISTGQSDVLNYWWLSIIPGIAIFISVTAYNLGGDALREAIDPRLRE